MRMRSILRFRELPTENRPPYRSEWASLGIWIVMALALSVRIWWITQVHPMPASDFMWYQREGISILHGYGYQYKGHPTAYFPIGYPLFLSAVYGVLGVHWLSGVLANIVLNTATVGLVYAIAYRLYGPIFGWVSGILMAVYMPHVEWSSVLCSEMLFTFLLLLTNYLWVRYTPRETPFIVLISSGVTLGLASVVRPVTLLLPAVLFFYYLVTKLGFLASLRKALVVLAVMAVTISPVTIRNYVHFHQVIPVSTNGGVNLWQGNNPQSNGEYYWPLNAKDNPFLHYVDNEVKDNQLATKMAKQYILEHPWTTIERGFVKWGNLFNNVDNAQVWSMGHSKRPVSMMFRETIGTIALVEYRLTLFLAVVGFALQYMYMYSRRDRRSVMLWCTMGYYFLLFFIFPAWDRMRAPIEPWIILLAGFALVAFVQPKRCFENREQTLQPTGSSSHDSLINP